MKSTDTLENQSRKLFSSKLRVLTLSGVLGALICLATQISLPTGIGYVNLGDGVLMTGGFLLGPIGFFPAAVGSALTDLFLGYIPYIPATFVIKGIMGLLSGILLRKDQVTVLRKIVVFTLCELIMTVGYFLYEIPLEGLYPAIGSIVPNLLQGFAGIFLALFLTHFLGKWKMSVILK